MENNEFSMIFEAKSVNEAFARNVVASFCLDVDPTVEWLSDVKTAVSEAVTNCIVHAYKEKGGKIELRASISAEYGLKVSVTDYGIGIEDVEKAMQPFFSSAIEKERSGMGFTVMQTFMDTFEIESAINKGTTVHMTKKIMCGGNNA